MTYPAGDHLGVLPRNGVDLIRRVIARFGLDAGPVRHDHPEQRHAPPTCPSASPTRCSACSPAASSCRTSRAAPTSPRWPGHTDDPAQTGRARALAGDDEESGPATGSRCTRPTARCSTCSRQYPACDLPFAEYLDLLRRCGRATTRSPRRRWSSPDVCSMTVGVLEGPARSGRRHVHRGVCSGHLAERPRRRHRVRLRPAAEHRLPAAGEPAHPDDHGRRGHRAGAVPRVPPGAGGARGPGRADRARRCCSSAAATARTTCSTPTSWRPTRRTASSRVESVLLPSPAHPRRYVQHAMLELGRRGVGPDAARRRGLRVRQRLHDGPGRPGGPDAVFRAKTGAGRGRRRGLARGAAARATAPRGHLGLRRAAPLLAGGAYSAATSCPPWCCTPGVTRSVGSDAPAGLPCCRPRRPRVPHSQRIRTILPTSGPHRPRTTIAGGVLTGLPRHPSGRAAAFPRGGRPA